MELYKKKLVFDDFILYGRLKTNFCIVDLETTGVDPDKDKIIAFGYLLWANHKIEARTYILKDPGEYNTYFRWIKTTVRALQDDYVLYAYNRKFEEAFLGINGIRDLLNGYVKTCYDWYDDAPYDCIKWAKMRYVLGYILNEKLEKIPGEILEILELEEIENKEIPELYLRDWLLDRDIRALELIANHNLIDLVGEFIIYQYIIGLIDELIRQLERKKYFPVALPEILESFLRK